MELEVSLGEPFSQDPKIYINITLFKKELST